MAKEEAGELKAAICLRNSNHTEAKCRMFRNTRHIEGKMKGGSTSKSITTVDNKIVEHTKI